LLLETSGRVGQVGVAFNEVLLEGRRLDAARRHARDLVPAAAELLERQGWRPRDLDGVIVSRGPGSYTGLRVGLMAAKTLAYATGCRLIALETFPIVAFQAPTDGASLEVIGDALKGLLYAQTFRRDDADRWRAASELRIQNAERWLDGLPPGARVVGSAVPSLRAQLSGRFTEEEPRLDSLLALGLERIDRGEGDDPMAVEPLYLRASSAEEQYRRQA
jgi:tRNA threonylcarbamoyladenosine biosynthesis protein TsaB